MRWALFPLRFFLLLLFIPVFLFVAIFDTLTVVLTWKIFSRKGRREFGSLWLGMWQWAIGRMTTSELMQREKGPGMVLLAALSTLVVALLLIYWRAG